LNFDVVPNEVLVRTSFLGAAKASKGRNLGCKDNRVCFMTILFSLNHLYIFFGLKNLSCFDCCFLQLFFPIVDSHHWFLFAVDFEFKLFAFLDSYHDKDSSFHKRIKNSLVGADFQFNLIHDVVLSLLFSDPCIV
jgi:hypothetical protein